MNYTLKSGAKVEGTVDQIITICKSVGETVDLSQISETPSGFYASETKGLVKISEMNEHHLRNALLKQSKEHFETLGKKSTLTNIQFLKEYASLTEKSVVVELFSELSKRK